MSRDARAAVAAIVAVVAVVILGCRFLGSPASQRLIQSDLRTVQALNQLAQQIEQKSRSSNNELPANLDSFPDFVKHDPITHKSFIYKPRSATQYELCATFAAKSPEVQPEPNLHQANESRWAHPGGSTAFLWILHSLSLPLPIRTKYADTSRLLVGVLRQNSRGASAGSLAILSNSGYFSRRGSGTLTFDSLNIAISSSAFTTALP